MAVSQKTLSFLLKGLADKSSPLQSWTLEESQVESAEHQDNADIHYQPFPESVSEEREIDADDDGDHRHHIKHDSDLSAHFPSPSAAPLSARLRWPIRAPLHPTFQVILRRENEFNSLIWLLVQAKRACEEFCNEKMEAYLKNARVYFIEQRWRQKKQAA